MDSMDTNCLRDVEKAIEMCEEYNKYMIQFNDKFGWTKNIKK